MPIRAFPDPNETDEEGVLAIGGDLEPESLVLAYSQGIFPWPISAKLPLVWFSPPRRAVLEFDALHLPRSLKAAQKRAKFTLTLDQAFASVIRECARQPRPGQKGTWITRAMIAAYARLHELGLAHSAEAWSGETLVGGIYGVSIGGTFAGESMFHTEPNASKLALLHLVEHLRARGLEWMDIQVLTPHLEALGAREITRAEFLKRLKSAQARRLTLFPSR